MIGAINSLENLNEKRDKITHRISELNTNITNLIAGKSKSIKTFLKIKTKEEELSAMEKEKDTLERNRSDLNTIIKLATYNMENYIEFFKVEKLAGYYQSLTQVAEIQKNNSINITDFWGTVRNDKNIQKLMNE
jgi:predicted  nucleic acid-binding Zn-ribbon protein